MQSSFVKALIFMILSFCCCEAFGDELLDQLSSQLNAAKSSIKVEPIKCPVAMDALVGLPVDVVVSKLGKPDVTDFGYDADGEVTVDQYIFANSSAPWMGIGVSVGEYSAIMPMGDMFTVVQFHYKANDKVSNARCYDH